MDSKITSNLPLLLKNSKAENNERQQPYQMHRSKTDESAHRTVAKMVPVEKTFPQKNKNHEGDQSK